MLDIFRARKAYELIEQTFGNQEICVDKARMTPIRDLEKLLGRTIMVARRDMLSEKPLIIAYRGELSRINNVLDEFTAESLELTNHLTYFYQQTKVVSKKLAYWENVQIGLNLNTNIIKTPGEVIFFDDKYLPINISHYATTD